MVKAKKTGSVTLELYGPKLYSATLVKKTNEKNVGIGFNLDDCPPLKKGMCVTFRDTDNSIELQKGTVHLKEADDEEYPGQWWGIKCDGEALCCEIIQNEILPLDYCANVVARTDEGSLAQKAGITVGSKVLEVNGIRKTAENRMEIDEIFRTAEKITLKLEGKPDRRYWNMFSQCRKERRRLLQRPNVSRSSETRQERILRRLNVPRYAQE